MAKLTIFTPTFNRSTLLKRGYEALLRQTNKNFIWLIIDDGSIDNTKEIVQQWQTDNIINIEYIYKTNGGLHTGYNTAIEHITTELCVCIDSDDFMPDDGVEKIINFWEDNKTDTVAGILGLDYTLDNKPIGGFFPSNVKTIKIIEMASKYNHYGDVKVVHRTALLKEVAPMPTFAGEKNFNPIYLFHQIDIKYPLLLLNENLCFVEYQSQGMSDQIYKQYVNSPRSFSELRKLIMSRSEASLALKYRSAIHYISSQIMIKNKDWLKESPQKVLTILALPLGIALFFFIKFKTKND